MSRQIDPEFEKWVEENNLTEGDLKYIQRTARNRAILYLFGTYFTSPLLIMAWAQYKTIKQRSFNPRIGVLFSLHSLAMYISFLMIFPLIVWAVAKKHGYGSGIRGLWKMGLIGEGEVSENRRQQFKKIKRASRKVRIIIAILIPVGILAVMFIGYNGDFGRMLAEQGWTQATVAELLLSNILTIDIFGLPVCAIINNIRLKRYLSYEKV